MRTKGRDPNERLLLAITKTIIWQLSEWARWTKFCTVIKYQSSLPSKHSCSKSFPILDAYKLKREQKNKWRNGWNWRIWGELFPCMPHHPPLHCCFALTPICIWPKCTNSSLYGNAQLHLFHKPANKELGNISHLSLTLGHKPVCLVFSSYGDETNHQILKQ